MEMGMQVKKKLGTTALGKFPYLQKLLWCGEERALHATLCASV